MRTVYFLVMAIGTLAVPIGLAAVLLLIHTLRKHHPGVLEEIDPAGFRTFYLPSQLKFFGFIARGGFRPLRDKRVNVCLSVWLACCVLVTVCMFVATFVRIE